MGVFDSVYTELICPYCGDAGEKEIQTKDIPDGYFDKYHIGDVAPQAKELHVAHGITGCKSAACLAWEKERWQGRVIGFGRDWNCRIYFDDTGKITHVESIQPTGIEERR